MRIRSIKPEFWRSDDIDALPPEDRLLFIGLWSYVDDNGVGRDRLSEIVADLFAGDVERDPRETFARVSRGLSNLSERGLITRYTVADRPFLAVVNWQKHQRIDKAAKPRYPAPDQGIPVPVATPSRESRETSAPGTGEQGNRGTEEQGRTDLSESSSDERAIALIEPTSEPLGELAPRVPKGTGYPAGFEEFWAAYPRHEGKRKALAAWQAARRRAGSEQPILDGARRYADDPNREAAYTAHAATWLNRDGWHDAPLPKRGPQSQYERLQQQSQDTHDALARMGIA